VSQLKTERTNLAKQLRHVDAALTVLGKLNGGSYTKPRRAVSASARKRMSLAQKARWANTVADKIATTLMPAQRRPRMTKHTMSASVRRKIAAAQRTRWAKVKAQQKKAA
jgi:hypothetical protein